MPSPVYRCASRTAIACALLAGCGGGDLQPIQLGDAAADGAVDEHRHHHDASRDASDDTGDDSGDDDDTGDDTSDDDAGPIPRSQIQSASPSEEGR